MPAPSKSSAIVTALKVANTPLRARDLAAACNEVHAEGYGNWTPATIVHQVKLLKAQGRIELTYIQGKKPGTKVAAYQLKENN